MPPQVLHLKSTLALRTIIKAVKIKKKYNLCQPKIVQSLKLESKKTNRDKWSKSGSNLRRTLLTSLSRRKSLKTTGRTLTLLQASRRGVHSKRKNLRICQESPFTQKQLKTQLKTRTKNTISLPDTPQEPLPHRSHPDWEERHCFQSQ